MTISGFVAFLGLFSPVCFVYSMQGYILIDRKGVDLDRKGGEELGKQEGKPKLRYNVFKNMSIFSKRKEEKDMGNTLETLTETKRILEDIFILSCNHKRELFKIVFIFLRL